MEELTELERAELAVDECWFIFSNTADWQDARLLSDAVAKWLELLSAQVEMEL